jgi:hypothetical protein
MGGRVNVDSGAATPRAPSAQTGDEPDEWFIPGRKTVEGYLHVVKGPMKRDYGLFGTFVAYAIEADHPGAVPRYPDSHGVWFDKDETKEPGHQFVWPMLKYKAGRPIQGLRSECSGHRVRLTCTVTKPWHNNLGAYIVRATGECLECDVSPVAERQRSRGEAAQTRGDQP